MNKKGSAGPALIIENRRAKREYFVESHLEGGLMLKGWEVKSLRAGQVNVGESYVTLKNGEAFWVGATIAPLQKASSHVVADPIRTRKVLLSRRELSRLVEAVGRQGYTLVPLSIYWIRAWVKIRLGLCKGKRLVDKRESEKKGEWKRTQQQLLKKLSR